MSGSKFSLKKYGIPFKYDFLFNALFVLTYIVLTNVCFVCNNLSNRYLVIIDDIWSRQAWKDIQCAFPENKNASRIMTLHEFMELLNHVAFRTTSMFTL